MKNLYGKTITMVELENFEPLPDVSEDVEVYEECDLCEVFGAVE